MRKYFQIGFFILTMLQVSCLQNRSEKKDSAKEIKQDFDNMLKLKDSIEREVLKKNPVIKERTDKIIDDIFKKMDEEKSKKRDTKSGGTKN